MLSRISRADRSATARLVLLLVLWLASLAIYHGAFLRPYGLADYLWTPKLSTGVIAERQAGPAATFIFAFVSLFVLYAAAYRLARGWRSVELAVVLALGGLAMALLLVPVYPIGANDVFGYITGGEMLAFYDVNPMVHAARDVPNLPLVEYSVYAHVPPNYGPLWTWLSAAVAWAVGKPDLLLLVLGFKVAAILPYLATSTLLILVLRRRAPDHVAAGLLVWAWNPLVLFEVAANAHNDVWIGLFGVLAVFMWETRHRLWMLLALTLAVLIKVPVAPLLAVFFVAAWRSEPAGLPRARLVVSAGLAIAAVVAALYLSLPEGLAGLANLQSRTDLFTHSLPAVVRLALSLAIPLDVAAVVAGAATVLALGGYTLLQMRNAWQAPGEAVRLGFNMLMFLLLVCMSWFQPWYLLWIIPLAAVYPRPDAPFQAGLFALCASWSYIVFGFVWFWIPGVVNWGRALGIELLAVINTYALSWEYAILSRRPGRGLGL